MHSHLGESLVAVAEAASLRRGDRAGGGGAAGGGGWQRRRGSPAAPCAPGLRYGRNELLIARQRRADVGNDPAPAALPVPLPATRPPAAG